MPKKNRFKIIEEEFFLAQKFSEIPHPLAASLPLEVSPAVLRAGVQKLAEDLMVVGDPSEATALLKNNLKTTETFLLVAMTRMSSVPSESLKSSDWIEDDSPLLLANLCGFVLDVLNGKEPR